MPMSTQRILIVEDEPKVALLIKKGLEENSFMADVAYTAVDGLEALKKTNYDLLVLDLGLPDMSGYTLCKVIRTDYLALPVLMLTALGTTEDKLAGFDSGADDYMVKPFEFREFVARIKALIKRSNQPNVKESIIRVADLELNLNTKMVKRQGKSIELTAKEFSLLELLMRNKEKVISRTEIAEKIWDINFDTGTNVIDVYINFLRKKIDRDHPNKLIHTHIGMGYTLRESEK
jgi:two-component system copper resistance phosphate regulon response regulator CusR